MKAPQWRDLRRDGLLQKELQQCLASQLAEQQRAQRTLFGEGSARVAELCTKSIRELLQCSRR
jgi:hypothetical protein